MISNTNNSNTSSLLIWLKPAQQGERGSDIYYYYKLSFKERIVGSLWGSKRRLIINNNHNRELSRLPLPRRQARAFRITNSLSPPSHRPLSFRRGGAWGLLLYYGTEEEEENRFVTRWKEVFCVSNSRGGGESVDTSETRSHEKEFAMAPLFTKC